MTWVGIGLIIIGVALLGLAAVLFKPLTKLAGVFSSLQKTTDQLPEKMESITSQTTEVLGTSVETLHQLNAQVKELSPVLHIVGDAGRATNQLTSSMLDAVEGMKENTDGARDFATRRNLEGLYGALTLGYFLFQKGRKTN